MERLGATHLEEKAHAKWSVAGRETGPAFLWYRPQEPLVDFLETPHQVLKGEDISGLTLNRPGFRGDSVS